MLLDPKVFCSLIRKLFVRQALKFSSFFIDSFNQWNKIKSILQACLCKEMKKYFSKDYKQCGECENIRNSTDWKSSEKAQALPLYLQRSFSYQFHKYWAHGMDLHPDSNIQNWFTISTFGTNFRSSKCFVFYSWSYY